MTHPNIWQQTIGHDEQVEMFRRSLERGRLSHAYLFVGPEGIGKKRFARTLAQCLMCETVPNVELGACCTCTTCRQIMAGTHPDFHSVGKLEGKSELTIDIFLGEKERRGREGLCYELSHRPTSADRKIAIIDDADSMNAESANAFLKTLEETPADAVILLIASNETSLLPTIRSRCQTVRFAELNAVQVAQLLLDLEWLEDQQEAEAVASISQGSLHLAAQLLQSTLRDARSRLYEAFSKGAFDPLALTKAMTATVDDVGGDSATQRVTANWVVRFATEFFRTAMLQLSGDASNSDGSSEPFLATLSGNNHCDLELLDRLIEITLETEMRIHQRVGVPLCFEQLFDSLAREMRNSQRLLTNSRS